MSKLISTTIKCYKCYLNKYPLTVQAIQTGCIMGIGDLIAQTAIEEKSWKDVNPVRTAQFVTIGTFFVGPVLTTWYRSLNIFFPATQGYKTVALKKVACDQFIFAPCFIYAFLGTLGMVQKRNLDAVKKDIKKNYKDILFTNYKIWPAVQVANFYLTPLNYQVLVVQIVAILWNSYLSWKTQLSNN